MGYQDNKRFLVQIIPAGIVFVILGAFLVYQFTQISALKKSVGSISTELASTTSSLEQNTKELSQNVIDLRAKTVGLSDTLSNTEQNISNVATQVGGVAQSVGNLQKLSQIDPELLKKYSKVYFLNENYVPPHLTIIPAEYLYSSSRSEQFLSEAWPFLKSLMDTAKSQGTTLYVESAYRSFAEQQSLKSLYKVIYGAGTANSFSADQGYSEHQLGTTLDFITTGLNGQLQGFDKTGAYQWLLDNAYRFGFELSYPKGNSYYIYEPWHWRFVGIKLATSLHDSKLNFYDVDQRQIDTYLINIFDNN